MRILYSPNGGYALLKKVHKQKVKKSTRTLFIELAKMTITSQARQPD